MWSGIVSAAIRREFLATNTSKVLDPRHTVYSVKGVTAIPLVEDRARNVLLSLASRNRHDRRTSLLPTELAAREFAVETTDDDLLAGSEDGDAEGKKLRVKFADQHEVKVVSPVADQEFDLSVDPTPPSPSSTASTPSSIQSTNSDAVVKTLAERLSFWTRLSKRNSKQVSTSDHTLVEQPDGTRLEPEELASLVKDQSKNPEEVIESVVSSAAPPPQTTEEKHSELEEKIVRECIREYTRGGMYFAYSFGESCSRLCHNDLLIKLSLQISRDRFSTSTSSEQERKHKMT